MFYYRCEIEKSKKMLLKYECDMGFKNRKNGFSPQSLSYKLTLKKKLKKSLFTNWQFLIKTKNQSSF